VFFITDLPYILIFQQHMSQSQKAHAYTQVTIQMQNTHDGNFQRHGVGKEKVLSMKFHHKDRGFLIPPGGLADKF